MSEAALFTFLFVLQSLASWMVMITDDLVMNFWWKWYMQLPIGIYLCFLFLWITAFLIVCEFVFDVH
jgi:hypothetical protein